MNQGMTRVPPRLLCDKPAIIWGLQNELEAWCSPQVFITWLQSPPKKAKSQPKEGLENRTQNIEKEMVCLKHSRGAYAAKGFWEARITVLNMAKFQNQVWEFLADQEYILLNFKQSSLSPFTHIHEHTCEAYY